MEILKTALLTNDKEYGDALCKCVRNIQPAINISRIEGENEASDYDMLITDGIDVDLDNMPICKLTLQEDDDKNSVYKYCNISNIVNKIVEIYENETGIYVNKIIANGNSLVYTISATCGGMGASSVAYAMAKDFAMAGKCKVLYLSLCDTYQEEQFFRCNKGLNIVDLLHRILYTDSKIQVERFTLMDDYGVSYFNTYGIKNHLIRINEDEFVKFISTILNSGVFDKIIVDAGNNLCSNANYLRKISYLNILIRNSKNYEYESEIKKNMTLGPNKLIMVENKRYKGNPKFDEFFETENQLDDSIDIGISTDEFSFVFRDGKIDIELDGEFGKDIRELINYIK